MALVVDVPGVPAAHQAPQEKAPFAPVATAEFLTAVLGGDVPTVHHLSHTEIAVGYRSRDGAMTPCSLLFQAANFCYDTHTRFSLAPEVVWYTILAEVGAAVRMSPAKYERIFTTKPRERQTVRVFIDEFVYGKPNDWTGGIAQFDGALRAALPDGIAERTLLRFSTSNAVTDVALLLALMNAASPFYDFRMTTRCGIPRVRLEGTHEDWKRVHAGASALSEVFDDLAGYFHVLLPVLSSIAETAGGARPEGAFWNNMYKVNHGSGGPYIDGWLTTLIAHVADPQGVIALRKRFTWGRTGEHGGALQSLEIPSHVSQTDFIWEYYGKMIPMRFVTGILSIARESEFLSPRLGFGVIEGRQG